MASNYQYIERPDNSSNYCRLCDKKYEYKRVTRGRPWPMFASEKCEATGYVNDEIHCEMK